MKGIWKKFGKFFTLISNSASFALFLSILFFSYESIENSKETEEVTQNLVGIQESLDPLVGSLADIESSLSTRYLGIFPEYIGNINNLLAEAKSANVNSHINDTVIIFEDVLHYGVLSDPAGFKKLMRNLLDLSMNGCQVTIVHYNPNGMQFKQMVTDELISTDVQLTYRNERRALSQLARDTASFQHWMSKEGDIIEKYFGESYDLENEADQKLVMDIIRGGNGKRFSVEQLGNYMLEYNFAANKVANREKFEKSLDKILNNKLAVDTISNDRVECKVNTLCKSLDSLKLHYMNKPLEDVRYSDYFDLYTQMTAAIAQTLDVSPTIEIIPIDESIMMCCWMIDIDGNQKAIFAFPSKYSTDEIGFISKDAAIIKYINTMLKGVKNNYESTRPRRKAKV